MEKASCPACMRWSQTTPPPRIAKGATVHPNKCGLAILCFCIEMVVLQAAESIEQDQDDDAHPDCEDHEHNNQLLAIHFYIPST